MPLRFNHSPSSPSDPLSITAKKSFLDKIDHLENENFQLKQLFQKYHFLNGKYNALKADYQELQTHNTELRQKWMKQRKS
jgi:hypothetical protein